MYSLAHPLRDALRTLRRNPTFVAIVVLTLALGTGATTAVYSVVDAVLLRPLPFAEPDRLVRIWESNPQKGQDKSAVLPGSLADWSARSRSFEGMASYSTARLLLTVGDGSEYIRDASVSRSLFSTLGVQPVLGRVFLPDEWASVISDRLWRRKFGADPNVIGKDISFQRLGHAPIVGVMPAGFDFPGGVDSWSPANVNPASRGERGVRQAIAKLKPGVTVDRALDELKGIARQAERDHPDTNAGWTVVAEPLLDATVNNVRPALLLLLAAVGCLLLIGCANLGNLLLARATARSRDLAVRAALGATRGRLLVDCLVENAVLALAGCAAGILPAWILVRTLVAFAPADLPRLDTVGINWRVLGFTCLISAAVAGLLTAVSSLNQLRRDGEQGLADRLRTRRWRGRTRARQALVALQVTLTFALLVEVGLLLRTFVSLRQVDLGVRAPSVLTTEVALPIGKFPRTRFPAWSRLSWDRYARFYRDLLEYVRGLPGVEAIAGVNTVPVTGNEPWLFTRGTDFNKALPGERWSVVRHVVTPGYFEALGIPIVRGRAFSSLADNIDDVLNGSSRPRTGAAVVNEALARRYWAGDPIGQPIALASDSAVSFRTVVGITRTVRSTPLDTETPVIYIPYDQFPDYRMTLILRAREGSARQVGGILPAALRTFERDLAISGVVPYADLVGNSIARQRFTLLLLGAFAGVGLALAMAGVYGLVTYLVGQRTHEIAMRIALGAKPESVVQLLVRDSFRPIGLGLGAGVLASLVLGRLALSELHGVTPTDVWTYVTVSSLLAILGVIATWLPAHRAAGQDPAALLKRE